MDKLSFDANKYKQTSNVRHELTEHAQRLCDKIGIPFDKMMLRAIKTNSEKADQVASYMKERGIASIRYFTKVFYS